MYHAGNNNLSHVKHDLHLNTRILAANTVHERFICAKRLIVLLGTA
jgi:hypothetical protein